jgi:ABC-type oligopeptide transport system ATPase subunit
MTAYSKHFNCVRLLIKKLVERQKGAKELDSVFLVCGEEGSGKSNTMLSIIDEYEKQTGTIVDIKQVPTNLRELLTSLYKRKKNIHALDEGEELNNLNKDSIVKDTKSVFVVSRADAQITLISYPNPFRIHAYFKEDRAKGIFFCYKQKYVYYFSRKAFRDIRFQASLNPMVKGLDDFVTIYKSKATFIDIVPLYKGHLLEEYKKRKRDNIDKVFEDVIDKIDSVEKKYSLGQVSKKLMLNRLTLIKYIEAGMLKVEWNGNNTQRYVTDEALESFKQKLKEEVKI